MKLLVSLSVLVLIAGCASDVADSDPTLEPASSEPVFSSTATTPTTTVLESNTLPTLQQPSPRDEILENTTVVMVDEEPMAEEEPMSEDALAEMMAARAEAEAAEAAAMAEEEPMMREVEVDELMALQRCETATDIYFAYSDRYGAAVSRMSTAQASGELYLAATELRTAESFLDKAEEAFIVMELVCKEITPADIASLAPALETSRQEMNVAVAACREKDLGC